MDEPMSTTERTGEAVAVSMRLAGEHDVVAVANAVEAARADGVCMDASDADRPTTWWVALVDGAVVGICGMMPVENGGQRLRGSWVAPGWRRRGIWWTMVQFRVTEAWERGAEWVETYAVHPGPMLRRGWEVKSTKHRNGAVHVGRRLVEAAHLPTCGYLGNDAWSCSLDCPVMREAAGRSPLRSEGL